MWRLSLAIGLCCGGLLLGFSAGASRPRLENSSSRAAAVAPLKFYFDGVTNDDANRVVGTPSATFDANTPTGSSDVTQTGGANGDSNQAANSSSVYWLSTAYLGPINGTISFDWYWSGAAPATDTVTVTIYVDVDPANNSGHRIGKASVPIQVGVTPMLNHTEVPNVYGFAMTNLLVQVTATSADTAHYNSIATPSSFTLPFVRPSGWSIFPSADPPAGQANYLKGVDCTSTTNCWAVGYAQNVGTLTEHYDGVAWSVVPSPNTSGTLFSVRCASANDCWAVGYTANVIYQTLTEHWDGTAWSVTSSPNPLGSQNNFFNGVTCVSANDCWAVGDYYMGLPGTHHQTLIEHWDGSAWTIVTSPNTSTSQENVLYAASCPAPNDCWAVGSNDSLGRTMIQHWNGASWSIVPSPNATTTRTNYLYNIACGSSTNCWAIGKYYAAGSTNSGAFYDTMVLHYDGTSWTLATSPSPGTWSNDLWGVSCPGANDCWIAGYYGYPASGAYPMMFHNNGSGWLPSTAQSLTHQNIPLYSIACPSPNECWAVGNYNDGNCTGCFDHTLIEHYTTPLAKITAVAGQFALSGQAEPRSLIDIEASPDLIQPFVSIGSTTSDATGMFQFSDADAGNFSKRFYRATYP